MQAVVPHFLFVLIVQGPILLEALVNGFGVAHARIGLSSFSWRGYQVHFARTNFWGIQEAVEQFREFLRTQGYSGPLQWIAPGDVAFWCGGLLIQRRSGAEDHAKHVFDRAQERGFSVSIQAIAQLDHSICCFVFAPDDAEGAARSFVAPPLTMKVRQGLRPAQEPSGVLWWAATTLRSTRARSRDLQVFGYDLGRRNAAENV